MRDPTGVRAGVAVDEALRAFLAVLDSYTLADLVRPRMALARLLRIDEPLEPELAYKETSQRPVNIPPA